MLSITSVCNLTLDADHSFSSRLRLRYQVWRGGVKAHRNKIYAVLDHSFHHCSTPFWNTQEHAALFIAQKAPQTSRPGLPEMTSMIDIRRWKNTDGFRKKMADCDDDEMFLDSGFDGPVLPWDRFRRWVTCFCVVTFDIELGQALEVSIAIHWLCSHGSRERAILYPENRIIKHVVMVNLLRLVLFDALNPFLFVTARLPRTYRTHGPWGKLDLENTFYS